MYYVLCRYLVDGKPPQRCAAKTVLVTSPDFGIWKVRFPACSPIASFPEAPQVLVALLADPVVHLGSCKAARLPGEMFASLELGRG